jgi:tetratricopeptide (TPR) repeat protein
LRIKNPRYGRLQICATIAALDIGACAFQAFSVAMKFMSRIKIFLVCAGLVLGAKLFAAQTNSIAPPSPADASAQNAANGYLQIQQQLHDTQVALENNRAEAAAAAQRNADAMAARLQALEQNIDAQRKSDIESAQKAQELMLSLVAAFGSAGLAIMLLMVYFQWRVVRRLVDLPTMQPQLLAGGQSPSLIGNATVGESNAKLFGAVDQLQKRILELEQSSRGVLAEKNPPATNGSHKISETVSEAKSEMKNGDSTAKDREECVANLIVEGQALMDANNAEKALDCFDVALGLDAKHVEALVKKGGALEKLGRTDEAIKCYDRAIEANHSATIAYLQKGGLFNRLARYDEALQCYEMALRTQEKTPAAK